ncbi:MAG: hypothetical protein HY438_00665 [DPANN group archaeon]|nr:hypothetical protein [DPANN group archaeon]
MGIEDALLEVSKNMLYAPASVFHGVMDSAPLLHDLDSGQLDEIADEESAGVVILTRREAATMLDFLQDFQMGYASDGHGNTVPVPIAPYQHIPSFKEKHPTFYKVGKIALLTAGVLLAGVAVAGCADETGYDGHKITEKRYDFGFDHTYGTADDQVLIKIESDNNWYSFSREGGFNASGINNKIGIGDKINFNNMDDGSKAGSLEFPRRVSELINYQTQEQAKIIMKQKAEKDAADEKERAARWENDKYWVLGGVSVAAGLIGFLASLNRIDKYLQKKRQARRIKNK